MKRIAKERSHIKEDWVFSGYAVWGTETPALALMSFFPWSERDTLLLLENAWCVSA